MPPKPSKGSKRASDFESDENPRKQGPLALAADGGVGDVTPRPEEQPRQHGSVTPGSSISRAEKPRTDASPADSRIIVQVRGAAAPDGDKAMLSAAGWDCSCRALDKCILTGLEVSTGKPVALAFKSITALLDIARRVRVGGRVEVSREGRATGSIGDVWGQYELYTCIGTPDVVLESAGELLPGRPVGPVMEEGALAAVLQGAGAQSVLSGFYALTMVVTVVRKPVSGAAPGVMVGKCSGVGDDISIKLWGAGTAPMKQALDDMERNIGALVIVPGVMKKGKEYRGKAPETDWELHVNNPHFPYVVDTQSFMGRMLVAKVAKKLPDGVTLKVPASVAGKREALLVLGDGLQIDEDKVRVELKMMSLDNKLLGEVLVTDGMVLNELFREDVATMCGGDASDVDVVRVFETQPDVVDVMRQMVVKAHVEVTAVKTEAGPMEHIVTMVFAGPTA